MDWDECLVRSRRVAARRIGEETYIVSPSDSMLHLLPNDVAGRIWEMADGRHSLRQILQQVCDEYEVVPEVARADVEEFVDSLVSKGLATLDPRPGPSAED